MLKTFNKETRCRKYDTMNDDVSYKALEIFLKSAIPECLQSRLACHFQQQQAHLEMPAAFEKERGINRGKSVRGSLNRTDTRESYGICRKYDVKCPRLNS